MEQCLGGTGGASCLHAPGTAGNDLQQCFSMAFLVFVVLFGFVLFCFALKKLFEACSAFYPGLVIGLSEGKKTRRGKGSQRKVGKETTHHVGV